jgi:hypothetical protein
VGFDQLINFVRLAAVLADRRDDDRRPLRPRRLGPVRARSDPERTRAGLVAAATRGRKGGRKPVVTERARTIIAKGLTVREAAVRLKVGKTALYDQELRALKREPF